MDRVRAFFTRPKNLYLSVLLMFTVVMGLASISFSYYVDESTNNTKLVELNVIDNRITSDELIDGKIVLGPQETKEIEVYVMSNNDFDTEYELYYLVDSEYVEVVTSDNTKGTLGSKDVHMINLVIENYEEKEVEVLIGMKYKETIIDIDNTINYDELDDPEYYVFEMACKFYSEVYNREKLAFIIEDADENIFGTYFNVKIFSRSKEIDDPNAFIFSLRSHGRSDKPIKFKIKKGVKFHSFSNENGYHSDLNLFSIDDIKIPKPYYKTPCSYLEKSFNYGKRKGILIGKEQGNFMLKRLQVWQMADPI